MITKISGDVTNAKETIIAHQTNCMGVMGSGVAKALRAKYPDLFGQYKVYCDEVGLHNLLGTTQFVETEGKVIANMFGQYRYGRDKQHTDYLALMECFEAVNSYALKNGLSIALPYLIGCGLGGGEWSVVFDMAEKVFTEVDLTFYEL